MYLHIGPLLYAVVIEAARVRKTLMVLFGEESV